ncbi:hypothetical protein E1262_25340 [Jiangella aurantiaca]|uniref:Single-stranded DNA-binding protein n=2 Tax=Jiangella aurantiaca TaxID=2530373 RepID=A0A4R5A407_9ACTN|nr:hypothetical protein E1262_25340 [Jiangella aurantiaca]
MCTARHQLATPEGGPRVRAEMCAAGATPTSDQHPRWEETTMSNAFPASPAGRIATDPKLVAGANPRLTFRLAVDDRAQEDGQWITKQTVFHDVVVFGRSAETYARLYRRVIP